MSYHRTRITNHTTKTLDKAFLLTTLRIHIIEFVDANSSRLAHVGILIVNALTQGHNQIFYNLLYTDTSHRTESQSTNQRIGIFCVTDECVNGQNNQLGLSFGVVNQISINQKQTTNLQINKLLQL